MVDFNESEGESAFLVVRSTRGVWFDNPHTFHRSLAKVKLSFCFAPEEGAQVQTELGPTASVKAGITSLPPSLLGAKAVRVCLSQISNLLPTRSHLAHRRAAPRTTS